MSGDERERARRRAERRVGAAFLLSAAAFAALTAVYALGGQPQVEGALLLVGLGSLGAGLLVWSRRLMPGGPVVERREPPPAAEEEQEALLEEAARGTGALSRSSFLRRSLLAAVGALAVAAVLPVRSLGPRPGRALFETGWGPGTRVVDELGRPVRAGDMPPGSMVTVFPEGQVGRADSQVALIRLGEEEVARRPLPGGEGWAPRGHVAYSKVCTHLGCPVGLYQTDERRLFCPCEQSAFDVVDGARPLSGPATRPLPQLPLLVDGDGVLRSRGDFAEPVGPGFWNRT